MTERCLTCLAVVVCLVLAAPVHAEEQAAPPPANPTPEEIAAIFQLRQVLEHLEVLENLDTLEVMPLLKEQEDDR